jgi:hypothetical protein
MLGYKHTPEAIAKMVARFVDQNNHPFFGKKHSAETKLILSKPGKLRPRFGYKYTAEEKQRHSIPHRPLGEGGVDGLDGCSSGDPLRGGNI